MFDQRATSGTEPRQGFSDWPARVARRTPLAVGVAPSERWLSEWGLPNDLRGAAEFCERLLDVVGQVAAVKVQTPHFERFGPDGLALMATFFAGCAQRGTLTIADAKRCDTEDTMESYASLYLGEESVLGADAVTVAPFLGLDATLPLFDLARRRRCAVFVLVRTSNHEARNQLARDGQGRTVSELIADGIAAHNLKSAQNGGLGPAAAVVGAPSHAMAALLRRMPHTLVSLPGLGRPGRTTDEFRATIGREGSRVVLPITSGVLGAGPRGLAERIRHWQHALQSLPV
ncbi:orotidine-5'-phosphate decarboxylase [Streptomyces sp. NPDC050164]|uniref:orotidine-5'-phosphate decarboxylase n=1 Tax=Streptomyces sp. NPDC050164 TaxID=3365605 RepID=UPI00379CCF02